jgi:imidazolonepropionase-like amidohydrolase
LERAFLVALALLQFLVTNTHAAEPHTWIVGATVLSPERKDVGRKVNVLIEGDRIAALTESAPSDARQTAEVVDAAGGVLIPGLIDGHVHVQLVPGMTFPMTQEHPAIVSAYRTQAPRSYLMYGYTTVVDLVSTPGSTDDFMSAPVHPDVYRCGAVPVVNGYPSQNVPLAVRARVFPYFVVDPKSKEDVPSGTDPAAHTPAAVIARVKQAGNICVKAFFERGFGRDRNLPVPSPEVFAEIVKASHAAGMPVLLHATTLEAQRFGVEGHTDIFAHGMWRWNEFDNSATMPEPVRSLLDQVVSQHIGYMPTFQVIGGIRLLFEPGFFDRPEVASVAPKSLLDWFRSPAGHWYQEEQARGAPDEYMRQIFDAMLQRESKVVAYLAQQNANFLFGTDTPQGPVAGNLPGLNGYLEMQRLVAAKMSLRQLFEAATLNNAKAFGLADRIGTVETGKRANLVLLARSPLETVEAYAAIHAVWIGGRKLSPESLGAGQ